MQNQITTYDPMSDPQYLIPGDAITLPNGNHAIVCARGYHGQDGMAYDFIATDKEVISLTHAEVKPDQIVRDFQWSDRHLEELKGKQPLPIRLSPTPTICSVSPWTAGKGRRRRIEEAIRLILDCSENRTGV